MDGAAVDLAARGAATWNLEYRRIPPVGGWRDSIADVSAGVGALSSLSGDHGLDLGRVTVIGHSAGAQLGFFAAKTASVRPVGFVSLAGMLDLGNAGTGFDGLVSAFLGDGEGARLAMIDPIRALPAGVPTVAVHGLMDRSVTPDQSRRFVEAARAAGDRSRLVEVAEADHTDVVSPLAAGWEEVARACLGA
ncbi:MAG: prolyl oligopeptidase family serine peptidase [bacterium]|nr:prolyl oligopeptidase family serine peptidase [bacterium]